MWAGWRALIRSTCDFSTSLPLNYILENKLGIDREWYARYRSTAYLEKLTVMARIHSFLSMTKKSME